MGRRIGITHYTVQRVIDVNCGVEGRDLGGVTAAVQQHRSHELKDVPPGTIVTIRGQSQAMHASFGKHGARA